MAQIKAFESNIEKLNRMRTEHIDMNEELDQRINQMNLKYNNGGTVNESDIDEMLKLMANMTEDRRKINQQAVKCGEEDCLKSKNAKRYENMLDDFFAEHM